MSHHHCGEREKRKADDDHLQMGPLTGYQLLFIMQTKKFDKKVCYVIV